MFGVVGKLRNERTSILSFKVCPYMASVSILAFRFFFTQGHYEFIYQTLISANSVVNVDCFEV